MLPYKFDWLFKKVSPRTEVARKRIEPRLSPAFAAEVELLEPRTLLSASAGAVGSGSISGQKFNDLNGDGIQQRGDSGVTGVTVFLDQNRNGNLDTGEASTRTDSSGNYCFSQLAPGTYQVREVLPQGSIQTTLNPAPITLTGNQSDCGVNFGNFNTITICGTKFQDTNANGVRNPGEPGLSGVVIFLDTNNNGALNAGERSTTTDVNGNYSFTCVGPGTYHVREVVPTGFIQTTMNPADIVACSGTNVGGVVFGNFQTITICGTKFQDSNGNGVRNPGESGMSGVVIFLDTNNNGILNTGERSTTTDVNGNYSFSNVGPGTYNVREVQLANFIQMTNNPLPITVTTSGANVSGVLFGNMSVSELVVCGKLVFTGHNLTNLMDGTFACQVKYVANLYQTLLGRAPDLAGLLSYVRLLMAGYTEPQVAVIFKTNNRI